MHITAEQHLLLMDVTNLGESAVLGTMVIAGAAYFALIGRTRDSAALVLAFVFASCLIALLKIIFIGCGRHVLNIRSPSGHTALAFAVFGMLAVIVREGGGRARALLAALLVLLATFIAVSRVVLHFHTVPEACLGAAAGCACVFLARKVTGKMHSGAGGKAPNLFLLALCLSVAVALSYGAHVPAEETVGRISLWLTGRLAFCR